MFMDLDVCPGPVVHSMEVRLTPFQITKMDTREVRAFIFAQLGLDDDGSWTVTEWVTRDPLEYVFKVKVD